MKILIHTDEYLPTAQACTFRMRSFVEAFEKAGHEVVVLCSAANLERKAKKKAGQIIYSPAIKMKKKTTVMRMLNNLSFGFFSLFTAVSIKNVDVVITTSPPPLVSIPGWLIARMKKAKLVYDVRDIWPDVAIEMDMMAENGLYSKVFRKIAFFMYKHADLITTVTPGKVAKIKGYLRGFHKKKYDDHQVEMVSNGYDESVEQEEIDEELISRYHLDDTFTCVYIGNLGLAQGLDVLLKIASTTKHQEIQFLLFGKGAEREKLEQQAREAGLSQVKFCGVLPHEKVYTLLSHAHLSFIPLKNAQMKDSIPSKLYEALGIGCPVFLVAEGDACELIEETGFGCHVSPDHPEEMTARFDEMIDGYDEIIRHREHARELMHKKYSRQKNALALVKCLEELVKTGKKVKK